MVKNNDNNKKRRKNIFSPNRLFFWYFIFLLSGTFQVLHGQTHLSQYIDSARINNPQIIQLERQIKIMEIGKKSIVAIYQSPKAYLSSDINITPYFNNSGKVFSTNPAAKAIGYDIGITNGGLYSALMNVDIPVFTKKTTKNALFWQDQRINRLKISLQNLNYNLDQQITRLFYNALGAQLSYLIQKESVNLLNREVKIMEQLTRKGLYRLVDYELLKTTLSSDSIKLQNLATTYRLQLMQLKSFCGITGSNLNSLQMEDQTLSQPKATASSFLLPYTNDSLAAIAQNRLFNNKYLPQVKFYSNAGFNAVSLNGIERKLGISTGIRLSYNLFDGKQKQLSKARSLIQIDQAKKLRKIKSKNIHLQRETLLKAIDEAKKNLQKQKRLKQDYKNLISLYKTEVQKGQVPVTGFLMALRNYNNLRLSCGLQEITLNKLISEYNYWNH
jgi:hypothetical protein